MAVRLIAAILIAGATPALAQTKPGPLVTDPAKPFMHENSGITLPATLIGLPRGEGQEYVKPQLDVSFRYLPADNTEEISVYIYRVTSGAPALWFDVSSRSIEQRQSFGRKTRFEMPVVFTPPGQATASGLKAAWTLSDAPYRSTAIAIVPVGEWLVKLRYSSTTLETASLVRRLDEAIAELGWPSVMPVSPAASLIPDCSAPLKLDGTSKPVKADGGAAILDAMVASLGTKKDAKPMPAVPWCRDRQVATPAPMYRPLGTDDSYLAALSDSGRALWVRPSLAGVISKDAKPSWAVSIVLAGETINFQHRDRLPPPDQLGEILKEKPASRGSTWGKQRKIDIDSSQLK